jgi:outer membrane protein
MNSRKPTRIFLIFLLFHLSARAQEEWDWQKCIEYALKNNLQLTQAAYNTRLGEIDLKQQKLNFTPSINASSNYNLRVGNNYNFFTSEYTRELVHYQDYNLDVSQPVFDGLITRNSVAKSKYELQALKLDEEKLRSNIQLQILTAFLDIMNATEQYQQAVNQKAITQEQHDHTQSLIQAGAAAEKELLDVDAQLSSEELEISDIKNQLDLAYLSLKMILQLDVKQTFTVKIPELPKDLVITPLEDVNKIYEDALALRPEIKSSKLRIESAKKGISVAKGSYYPSISFLANTSSFYSSQSKITTQVLTGNSTAVGFVEGTLERVLIPETITEQNKNPYKRQLNQNLSFVFGMSLTVPIYNKYQVQTAVKEARLQYEGSIVTERIVEIDLYNTIQQAYIKAQAAIEKYNAAERNVRISTQSYDYAVERLNAGSINQLEVNLAKSKLFTAQSQLTQAKYEYLFNTKVLDYYQGKTIALE